MSDTLHFAYITCIFPFSRKIGNILKKKNQMFITHQASNLNHSVFFSKITLHLRKIYLEIFYLLPAAAHVPSVCYLRFSLYMFRFLISYVFINLFYCEYLHSTSVPTSTVTSINLELPK